MAGLCGWGVAGSAEGVVKGAEWGWRLLSVDHHVGPGGLW